MSFSLYKIKLFQDLVEIMVVLERALSSIGHPVSLKEGSSASSYLCNYVSLLASQGALLTAVSYLNNQAQVRFWVCWLPFCCRYQYDAI